MAKTKKGAKPLSEAELFEEVAKRLGNGFIPAAVVKRLASDDADDKQDADTATIVRAVVRALKEEIVDCVIQGYSINLTGLAAFEPVVKAGRKKGTIVRNPFDPDAKPKTLKADEPDKFALKVKKSASVGAKFPSLRSTDGQSLHEQLYVKPKKKKG